MNKTKNLTKKSFGISDLENIEKLVFLSQKKIFEINERQKQLQELVNSLEKDSKTNPVSAKKLKFIYHQFNIQVAPQFNQLQIFVDKLKKTQQEGSKGSQNLNGLVRAKKITQIV